MTRQPGYIVIGPMKAGTTWIHEYLAKRGDISLPQGVKETMFFDHHYHRGLPWYASHFAEPDKVSCSATVEVAPSYFHCAEAPARIKETLGTVRLVAIRRDPVARAWSHYLHMRRYGMTGKDFRGALAAHPEILAASRFDETLASWREFFPAEDILILDHDELRQAPESFAARIAGFIGVEPSPPAFFEAYDFTRNAAAMPRFPALAGLANRATFVLRGLKLYRVINVLKRAGVKKLLFGDPASSKVPQITKADRQFVLECLGGPRREADQPARATENDRR